MMTTDQPSLFDAPAARARTKAKIRQVDTRGSDWLDQWGWTAIQITAAQLRYFTADDVHQTLADIQAPAPHHPNVMGALFKRGQKGGLCTPTDRVTPSARPVTGGRHLRVWSSLTWGCN